MLEWEKGKRSGERTREAKREKVKGSSVQMPGDVPNKIFQELKRCITKEWAWYGVPTGHYPTTQPTITQLTTKIEDAFHLGKLAKLPRDETLQPLTTKAVSVGVAFSPEKGHDKGETGNGKDSVPPHRPRAPDPP
jgi:hypothetical protein